MSTGTTGFEKYWNSTFGVPQQLGYRLLRVAQDDRVSLFSERGLFDMSLIPILGIWDDQRFDVGMDEKWARVGERLGLPRNLGTELGLDILTDPITYLTGGLTAAGKAAATTRKALSTVQMRKALGMTPDLVEAAGLGRSKYVKALDDVLAGEAGFLDRGTRRTLEQAKRALKDIPEEETLAAALAKSEMREIQLGFPILASYGMKRTVAPGYSSWTRFALDKTGGSRIATSMLDATAKVVGKVGPLNAALDLAQTFGRAARTAGDPLRVFKPVADAPKDLVASAGRYLTKPADVLNRTLEKRGVDTVVDHVSDLMARGADINTALTKALGNSVVKKFGGTAELWQSVVGDFVHTPLTLQTLAEHLPKWRDNYKATVKAFNDGSLTDALTAVGEAQAAAAKRGPGALRAFDAGRAFGRVFTRGFVSDVSSKAFREAERNFRSAAATYTQQIGQLTHDLNRLKVEMAKAVGMGEVEFDRLMAKRMEMSATEDELQHLLARAQMEPGNLRNIKSLEAMATRLSSNLRSLHKVAAGGKNSEVHTRLLEALEPLYNGQALDGATIHAIYDGVAEVAEKITPDVWRAVEGGPSAAMLLTGPKKGEYLQFVSDDALLAEKVRLEKAAARGRGVIPEGAIADLDAFAGSLGVSREKALDVVRRGQGKVKPGGKFAPVDTARAAVLRSQLVPGAAQAAAQADLKAVNQLLEARAKKAHRYKQKPRVVTSRRPQPARALKGISVEGSSDLVDQILESLGQKPTRESRAVFASYFGGGTIDPGKGLTAAFKTLSAARELKRAAKAGVVVDPELFRQATTALQEVTDLLDEAFFKAMGEAGENYYGALNKVRDMIYTDAVRSGLITHGAPVGYLSRVRTYEKSQLMDKMLSDSEFYQVLDTSMPRLGAVMRRNADDLTLQDLNAIHRAFSESGGPGAARFIEQMDEFAVANGFSQGFAEFSEEALLPLMNRLAQGRRVSSTMHFAQSAFEEGAKDGSLLAGRIIYKVDAAGERIKYGERLKAGRTKFSKGDTAATEIGAEDLTRPEAKGFVVELDEPLADGRTQVTVTANQLSAGRTGLLNLGSPDFKPTAIEYGDDFAEEFRPAAAAFAQKAAHGRIKLSDLAEDVDSAVSALEEGAYLAWGNRDVLSGLLGAVGSQWQNFGTAVNLFDTAHFTLKKLATVWRPGFIIQNLASAPAQSMLVGASPKNALLGLWDAAVFLNADNAQIWSKYDRLATHIADPKTGLTGVVRKQVGAWNMEMLRVLRRNTDFRHLGPEFDQIAWRSTDGTAWTYRELAPHLRTLLLSSATREGLRGGSRISGSLARIAKKRGPVGEALQEAGEALNTATESAEVTARLSTMFALLREGQSPSRAAKNALLGHVNYADLTHAERNVAKRAFGFYTFFRKITPVVGAKFLREPAAAAKLASLVKSGFVKEDNNGNLVVDAAERRIAIDRLNPSLDTLKMLEYLGETVLGVTDMAGLGSASYRQEQVQGQVRPPISLGGATGVAVELFGDSPGGLRGAAEEMRDTFWLTRILLGETPEDKTMSEQLAESALAVKRIPPAQRTKDQLRYRLGQVIGDLNKKIQRTGDAELRARYREEIRNLRRMTIQLERNQ